MTAQVHPAADLLAVSFTLNGQPVTLQATTATPLAEALRETLALTGTKIGCGVGRCGACTVLVDGQPRNGCLTLAWQVEGRAVTTVEGLDALPAAAHVKAGLLEESAFQCGYCAPGFVVALTGFLGTHPLADDAAVIAALEGNICRCTGHHAIVRGALNAAARVRRAHGA